MKAWKICEDCWSIHLWWIFWPENVLKDNNYTTTRLTPESNVRGDCLFCGSPVVRDRRSIGHRLCAVNNIGTGSQRQRCTALRSDTAPRGNGWQPNIVDLLNTLFRWRCSHTARQRETPQRHCRWSWTFCSVSVSFCCRATTRVAVNVGLLTNDIADFIYKYSFTQMQSNKKAD